MLDLAQPETPFQSNRQSTRFIYSPYEIYTIRKQTQIKHSNKKNREAVGFCVAYSWKLLQFLHNTYAAVTQMKWEKLFFLWKDDKFIKDGEMLLYHSNVMQVYNLGK